MEIEHQHLEPAPLPPRRPSKREAYKFFKLVAQHQFEMILSDKKDAAVKAERASALAEERRIKTLLRTKVR